MKMREVVHFLERVAPLSLQESYDNCGLIIGEFDSYVDKVMVCLDNDEKAMESAVIQGCQLVISHHPAIFKAVKTFTGDTQSGKLLVKAIRNDISVYNYHTNFDAVKGGLTDLLCKRLEFVYAKVLKKLPAGPEDCGYGRVGILKPMKPEQFIEFVKSKLGIRNVRVVGHKTECISKVAVYNGSYDRDILGELAFHGVDALVTGDLKYHDAQELLERNIFTVDAGHYGTEKLFVSELAGILKEEFPDLAVVEHWGADVFSFE